MRARHVRELVEELYPTLSEGECSLTKDGIHPLALYTPLFEVRVLVAQLVEHKAENLGVAGSSPVQNSHGD